MVATATAILLFEARAAAQLVDPIDLQPSGWTAPETEEDEGWLAADEAFVGGPGSVIHRYVRGADGSWSHAQSIEPSRTGTRFGESFDVAGVRLFATDADDTGWVYVYERTGADYVQSAVIELAEPVWQVHADGDRIALWGTAGTRVLHLESGVWREKLLVPGSNVYFDLEGDVFVHVLATDAPRTVVIRRWDGMTWAIEGEIEAERDVRDLAVDGGRIFVSSGAMASEPQIEVFEHDAGGWSRSEAMIGRPGSVWFGRDLVVDGEVLAVSDISTRGDTDALGVHLFEGRDGHWAQQTFLAGAGHVLGIAEDRVLVTQRGQPPRIYRLAGTRTGAPCAASTECASGQCSDGVCCDRPCGVEQGLCMSCLATNGAEADGICSGYVPGCCNWDGACDDGNACTSDACVESMCVHVDACCDGPSDCDDGDPCTRDVCEGGRCTNPRSCEDASTPPLDASRPDATATDSGPEGDDDDDGGCGCRLARRTPPRPAALVLIAIALAGARKRRRRYRASAT